MSEPSKNEFEQAGDEQQTSLVADLIGLLKNNKKYWLIPLLIMLLILGLLIVLGGTAAAPFIYTLF